MAYASQEMKAARTPAIKQILKQYGLKGSLSIQHHSTLKLTITCCLASRAEPVDQRLVECAYIANNVQLMYTAVRANNLKRAFQLRDETKANIHSQTMRELYVDAVATAERHYTQMTPLELKNLLILECTH